MRGHFLLPTGWTGRRTTTFGDRGHVHARELRRAVARSLNAELNHPVSKRVWMKILDPNRALWTVNHSTGLFERRKDMVSFYLVQREE